MKLVGTILATTASLLALAAPAYARDQQFNIPAGAVKAALDRYARQTGVEIFYREDQVVASRTRGVTGAMDSEAALRKLLIGTGLEARRDSSGALSIVPAASSTLALRPASWSSAAQPSRIAEAQDGSDPANDSGSGLTEIIVTAQKRVENVQDTPISISVLGSETLEQRGINGVADLLSGAIPALKAGAQSGRANQMIITMRGISSGDSSQISRDSAVGFYIDGVYIARVQGLQSELFDLERIEVLRGPQGTLFGRNAVGGALNIISKRPTGELGVDIAGGLSNYDGRKLKGSINLPAFGNLAIKLDGIVAKRDGTVKNPYPGAWGWGEYKNWGFRGQAKWNPFDGLEMIYSYDKSRDKRATSYSNIARANEGAALTPILLVEPHRVKTSRLPVPLPPSVANVQGHSLLLNADLTDNLVFRSITAYRKLSQTMFDNDAGWLLGFRPFGSFGRASESFVKQDQFSQEVQFVGTTDRLEYVAGAFYFKEKAFESAYAPTVYQWNEDGTAYTEYPVPVSRTPPPDRAGDNHVKSIALFGQATLTPNILDDKLHLTGGLRWTHDRKRGALTRSRGDVIDIPYKFSSKRLDPMVTIAYDITDSINVYGKYSQAYRAGGAYSRSPTFRPFDEEVLKSFEIGFKSEFWDRKARLNIAGFISRFKGMQVVFPYPTNPSSGEIEGVPDDVKINGVEVDLTLAPVEGLTLSTSYSYLHTKKPAIISPLSGLEQPFNMAFSPKSSGTMAADYALPVGIGDLHFHADANYSSSFYTYSESPLSHGYFVVNGRLALEKVKVQGADVSLSFWAKNIFNETFDTFRFRTVNTPGLANVDAAAFNEPRTYGVELRVRY